MFIKAVINGLGMLLHWETYVVMVIYSIITIILPIVLSWLVSLGKEDVPPVVGCISQILGLLLQPIAIFISICILFPILIGGTSASWGAPFIFIASWPWIFFKIIGIMLVLVILTGLTPLGQSNSFLMFLMGDVVFVIFGHIIASTFPETGISYRQIIPGFFTTIGIVVMAAILSLIGRAVTVFLTVLLPDKNASVMVLIPITLISSIWWFMPVFIHGAWIQLKLGIVLGG